MQPEADSRADRTYRYPVDVLHLLVSPGHNYFGRPADGPGEHPTYDVEEAELVAGRGIVGDRFYGRAAHMDAAVTLFAVESLEAVAADLGLDGVPDPLLTRRNVVLRGADLNALVGQEFAIESDGAAGAGSDDGGSDGGGSDDGSSDDGGSEPSAAGTGGLVPAGASRVVLLAGRPAAPCAWMDRMIAPGAHAALRGRGGVRCRVVEGGVLRRGPAVLVSPVPLDPAAAGTARLRRPLP